MRLPEANRVHAARLRPLLAKELAEITGGRALWTMLLLVCPLVGYSFAQAVSLYSEASATASQTPGAATNLSPLDGILIPTFGAFYVAVTLLFPFVAIRVLGQEKESGSLRLLLQLPYRSSTIIVTKLAAVLAAWALVSIPALSALGAWVVLGGHLAPLETLNLMFGHVLYGLLVGSIACSRRRYRTARRRQPSSRLRRQLAHGCWTSRWPAALAGRRGLRNCR